MRVNTKRLMIGAMYGFADRVPPVVTPDILLGTAMGYVLRQGLFRVATQMMPNAYLVHERAKMGLHVVRCPTCHGVRPVFFKREEPILDPRVQA